MDTVSKLSRYAAQTGSSIRVIGEPKTIDNDLVHTDHTPGYGSAAKYVASTVREITLDASVYEKKSVTVIEIMGRHAGWLTAASALARKYKGDNPFFIYLPESAFDTEKFLKDVESAFEKNCNVVVCVSEGSMMRTVPLSVSMTVLWGQIPLVTKCLQAAENIWKIWFVTVLE